VTKTHTIGTILVKEDRDEARRLREQLSKLRHWMSGFETGSGKIIPNNDAARQTIMFLERIAPL